MVPFVPETLSSERSILRDGESKGSFYCKVNFIGSGVSPRIVGDFLERGLEEVKGSLLFLSGNNYHDNRVLILCGC